MYNLLTNGYNNSIIKIQKGNRQKQKKIKNNFKKLLTKNQKSSIIIIETGKNNNRKQNKKIKKTFKKLLTKL